MSTQSIDTQTTVSLRISPTVRQRLARLAQQNERTPSGEIRRAIDYYLSNFEAVDAALRRRAEVSS